VCYAETWADRTGFGPNPASADKFPIWGAHERRRFFGDKHWNEPLRWNLAAEKTGIRARVFCMSMGDWAEGRPDYAPYLVRLWDRIERTPWLDWLMLTKRPQLISKLCPLRLPRIWQGTTAVTQKWLDLRWPLLRAHGAEINWLSIEPQMERIVLPDDFLGLGPRGWVICGGQSGARTRYLDPAWARLLRDQCAEAGVAFHMKQMSGRTKAELEGIPLDLRIRQFPEVRP
jgi:protein gp37